MEGKRTIALAEGLMLAVTIQIQCGDAPPRPLTANLAAGADLCAGCGGRGHDMCWASRFELETGIAKDPLYLMQYGDYYADVSNREIPGIHVTLLLQTLKEQSAIGVKLARRSLGLATPGQSRS